MLWRGLAMSKLSQDSILYGYQSAASATALAETRTAAPAANRSDNFMFDSLAFPVGTNVPMTRLSLPESVAALCSAAFVTIWRDRADICKGRYFELGFRKIRNLKIGLPGAPQGNSGMSLNLRQIRYFVAAAEAGKVVAAASAVGISPSAITE